MRGFTLAPQLSTDSIFIAEGPLSQVRLMNDARFPWLLLVPRIAGVSEWIDLDGAQQRLLLAEINQLSRLLRDEPGIQKLNIGALGNLVRQLHLHLIGRHDRDAAWPGPVWGTGQARPYADHLLAERIEYWRQRLG